MPIKDLNEEEKERLMVETGEDIQVMRVFIADLLPALSLEVLKEVAGRDEVYQRLMVAVKQGRKPKDQDMVPYMAVWEELGVVEELLCRGERIVILEGRYEKYDVELRDWVVDIGRSAHQGRPPPRGSSGSDSGSQGWTGPWRGESAPACPAKPA